MLAPFIVSAANGGFYGALDVPQHLSAHVADGCAEGVDTIRGREIVDTLSWEHRGITHTVMGNIPYDEIMKIAEGIR